MSPFKSRRPTPQPRESRRPKRVACLLGLALAVGASLACATPSLRAETRRSVVEFGAVGDGARLNTEQVQRAIDWVAASGGGTVEIPRGTFRSGSLFLRQGVELFVAEGGVLLGSNRIEDYPRRPTRIEGHTEPWRMALINAERLTGVRIRGKGSIDGNGILFWAAFWQRRKENAACTNLEVERPRLIFCADCEDVRIEGLSLRDSGFWNLHLFRCRGVQLDGLRITSPTRGDILAPSTDGVDIDSSRDVAIRRCFISVNDDNIVLKGSKGPFADRDRESPPVENIDIEDCEFGDGNAALTCGSEATEVRNVTMRRVSVSGDNRVLMLKLRPDTPQHYSHIRIEGVRLSGPGRIVTVEPWTQFFDLKGQPPPQRTVEDVVIRDVRGSFHGFGRIVASPGDTVRDITIEDVDVTLEKGGFETSGVRGLRLVNVRVNGAPLASP